MKKFILIILFSFEAFKVSAQWGYLNSGTTRNLNKVAFTSPTAGYVLPFSGPLYRTTDGGITWDSLSPITIHGPGLMDNDLSFINDSIGFIGTHDMAGIIKLYKTTDMSNTWTEITPFINIQGKVEVQFFPSNRG